MPQKENSEVEKFFEGLPSQDKKVEADIFSEKPAADSIPAKEEDEVVDESVKNRRHKRLEKQLQAERESNIALAERVKVLSEVEKFSKETGVDTDIAKLFDNSETGKENALRLSAKLEEVGKIAEERAIARLKKEQSDAVEATKKYESYIDSQFESLEDEFNVDLTSDAPAARKARREFGELLEKVSPKDDNGEIKEYADFHSTFEMYKNSRTEEKAPSRQKEIASKTMQKSGPTDSGSSGYDANLAYLRSIGVNV